MHAFLCILVIFLAPANGKPESVQVQGFLSTSPSNCEIQRQLLTSSLMQKPGVSSVAGTCLEVANAADRPT